MKLFGWPRAGNKAKKIWAQNQRVDQRMLERTDKPIRDPWIGPEYNSNQNGLFIVGESHYWDQDDRDNPDMTNMVIKSVISGTRLAFFTKIEAAVRGVESMRSEPEAFWRKHAFANFYQGAFPLARTRPPGMEKEMCTRGVETFPQVLTKVNSKRMLVVSKKVWDKFNKWNTIRWTGKDSIIHENQSVDTGYLTDIDGQFHVYCTWIPHASALGWGNPMRWAPLIQEFMSRDLDPPPTS